MTATTPDTSVVIAGLCAWHPDHELARPLLGTEAIGHVLVESFAVLTRLPRGRVVLPSLAWTALSETFRSDPLTLSGPDIAELIGRLASEGISGGAVYDALVAETARRNDLVLLTLDERAVATYRAVGVEVEFLRA